MPRPRDSCVKSYELIFLALNEGSKSWAQLLEETDLHKDTLSRRLKYLSGREMVRREKRGRGVIYSIIKSEPPEMGWDIPWQCLCMTKEDWEKMYRDVDIELMRFELTRRYNKFIYTEINKILALSNNNELYNKIMEEGMPDVKMSIFLQNLKTPFCLECLDKTKKLMRSNYNTDTGEYICPKCGLVIDKVQIYDNVYEYFKHYKPNNSN